MINTFNEFKTNFERRFNLQSILDLGEDSVRYDFFISFMNNNNLQPGSPLAIKLSWLGSF